MHEDNPLLDQYLLEKALAKRLLNATPQERKNLYTEVYATFDASLPPERKLLLKPAPKEKNYINQLLAKALQPQLNSDAVIMEIGGGDGSLGMLLAAQVKKMIIVESIDEIAATSFPPKNFQLLLKDTPPYPFEDTTFNLIFSVHFLEHIHPDDAVAHLQEVFRLLKKGGAYVCFTPNRLLGPHDISKYFGDEIATGLHLKEYTHGDLQQLMKQVGFTSVEVIKIDQDLFPLPLSIINFIEKVFLHIPTKWRIKLWNQLFFFTKPPFRPLEQVKLIARK
ncbi:MAG: class I SAM-dependent methyltransferase [Saprospiraceae bacterium]